MKKNRHNSNRSINPAMGELAFFLLAWALAVIAALNGDRSHSGPGNNLAASDSYSGMTDILD